MEIDEVDPVQRAADPIEAEPDETKTKRLSAEPIRALVGEVQRITGDRLGAVARGMDVDERWLTAVMRGDIREVGQERARDLCEGISCEPADLWPQVAHVVPALDHQTSTTKIEPDRTLEPLWLEGVEGDGPALNF